MIFADDEDRRVPGESLHTNFVMDTAMGRESHPDRAGRRHAGPWLWLALAYDAGTFRRSGIRASRT